MPRNVEVTKTNAQKLRDYSRAHKLSFDVGYHLSMLANEADGKPSTGIDANAPSIDSLSADDKAALAAARSSLNI